MKNLSLFALLISFNSFAGISIISDLDDTIKITHVTNPLSAFGRGVFRTVTFTGMPLLLNEARSYTNELHILTASPDEIEKSVRRTLGNNGIKYDSVAFKNIFEGEDKLAYKVRKIKEIMEKSPDDFIFLGDDVDKDPEVFEVISKLYPDRVLATYVHVVRNREIPEGSIRIWTAGDIALRELKAGRMSVASAEKVLDSIIEEKDLHYIIPPTFNCPQIKYIWNWQDQGELSQKASAVSDKIVQMCFDRAEEKRYDDIMKEYYKN